MAQVQSGQLDPRRDNTLAYVGSSLLRAIEVSDFERRLGDLEATQSVQERALLRSSVDSKTLHRLWKDDQQTFGGRSEDELAFFTSKGFLARARWRISLLDA